MPWAKKIITFIIAGVAAVIFGGLSNAGKEIMSRGDWHAQKPIEKRKPPIGNVTTKPNLVNAENELAPRKKALYLTVHHTAIPLAGKAFAERMKQHQKTMHDYTIDAEDRSWRKRVFFLDVPYHYVISEKGEIAEGRELKYTAQSNTTYLTPIANHVTVALAGNFNETTPPRDQQKALVQLLVDLARQHNVPLKNISYHANVVKKGDTDCPGSLLIKIFPELLKEIKSAGIK
jgi:hypothetical protein